MIWAGSFLFDKLSLRINNSSRNRTNMHIESLLQNEPQVIIQNSRGNANYQQDADVIVTTKDRLYERVEQTQCQTKQPQELAPQAPKKICRICLEEDGHFIVPCTCSGSMKYIHYKCLEEWLLRSVGGKLSYSEFKKSKCEVCGTRYNFKSTKDRFFDIHMIRKNFAEHRESYIQFGAAVLVVLIAMLGLIIIIALINSDLHIGKIIKQYFLQDGGDKSNLNIILTSTVFVLLCVIIIAATIFSFQFGFRVQIKITKIENFSTIRSKSYKNLGKICIM